jgi:hypothetical protein
VASAVAGGAALLEWKGVTGLLDLLETALDFNVDSACTRCQR